jgi:hypothetical protein
MGLFKMTVKVTDRGSLNFDDRIRHFVAQDKSAKRAAAEMATRTSKNSFKRVRDVAPVRASRHGRGQMINNIKWAVRQDGSVGLRKQELDKAAPHWIIQEIGTNSRATLKVANKPRPVGRPAKGAQYVKTVKSQKGRRISSGLVFASRGGQFSAPGSATGQQLYLRSQVQGVPATRMRSQAAIVIRKEIKGQHFIKKGGEAGFREYRESVLAAARQQFKKGRR